MRWIVSDINNILVIICGIFYLVLCVFSIVTGIIYIMGIRKLNPLELSDSFVEKLSNEKKLEEFAVKMGYVTFVVGVVQGITAFSLFKGHSMVLYIISLGFTMFSICSVLFKLRSKVNSFSLIKFVFYVLILIILLLKSTRVLFF